MELPGLLPLDEPSGGLAPILVNAFLWGKCQVERKNSRDPNGKR